jgi:hypothetical protein
MQESVESANPIIPTLLVSKCDTYGFPNTFSHLSHFHFLINFHRLARRQVKL